MYSSAGINNGDGMNKLTTSVYTFEDLIKNDFLYVDKTDFIWSLVGHGKAMYFMSRPRRFGKSLTLSTLKAVFQGRKDLFTGLAIHSKDYDWTPYPVVHIDLGNCDSFTPQNLRSYLARILAEQSEIHGVSVLIQENELAISFESFLNAIAKKSQVVILIDEYDKPVLNTLMTPEATACRDILKGFYSTIKKCESLVRFAFVTGVSKFCHVSLFSELNLFTDITMSHEYATMFGYTQEEMEKYFADRIDLAVSKLNIPREKLLHEIKTWYDGYRFHADAKTVYNPVSIAQFFMNGAEFNNYWFSTGTPSFLMELVKANNFNFEKKLNEPVLGFAFDAFEIDRIDPLTLLLQTGYLTIKNSYVDEDLYERLYYLDFPNREVKAAFETYLISNYTNIPKETIGANVFQMVKAIKKRDINLFMDLLKTFFAAVPYDINMDVEGRFQLLFYAVFLLVDTRIEAESRTGNGRIDAVICDGDYVFIFEFKLGKSSEKAMSQIREKQYFLKFRHSGKRIILIGAYFDKETRQISQWNIEEP